MVAKKTKAKTTKRAPAKKAPKTTAKKTVGRKPRAGQALHPRKLSGKLLYEFKAASLELAMRRQAHEMVNDKLNTLSMDKTHAPVFALLSKRESAQADIKAAITEFAEVQKKVAEKFSIKPEDLHKYTFDTSTGAMTPSKVT